MLTLVLAASFPLLLTELNNYTVSSQTHKTRSSVFSQSSELAVFSRSNNCFKSVRIRRFSGLYFSAFGLNTEFLSSECCARGIEKGNDTLSCGFLLEL